jgi:uncharacterized protein
MRLATIERALRNLKAEDLRLLARQVAAEMARAHRPAIRKVELFVTESCNLRCDYCWVPKRPRVMNLDTARRAVDFLLADSGDGGRVEMTLFGGEPLLEWDLLQRVITYGEEKARALGKSIGWALTTNGTLLTQEMVEFGQRHRLNYLLSIDGAQAAHDTHRKFADGQGSFAEVARRLPVLKRFQGWVGTRMTITPATVPWLATSVASLVDLGVNQFLIGDDVQARWQRDDVLRLQEQWIAVGEFYHRMRSAGHPIRMAAFEKSKRDDCDNTNKWGCEAARDKICVVPSGDIYPCARFVDKSGIQNQFRLGHIDTGLTAERTRRELTDERDTIRYRCMRCRHRSTCLGGCPATNLLCTGSPFVAPRTDCLIHGFWQKLRLERPEFWEVSKIPFGPQAGGFDSECPPGGPPSRADCRPLN